MSGYIDAPGGNLANAYLSENIVSYPLASVPNNANTRAFALTYYQYANAFVSANVGSTDNNAPNAYLYDQTPLDQVGGGIVKYTRSFCQLPFTWYDVEQIVYTYPGLDSGRGTANWTPFGSRVPITVPKLATVRHSYAINANVPSANVSPVTIVTLNGEPINRIGQWFYGNSVLTVPNVDPVVWTISSDPTRFRGGIWEIVTKTVGAPNVFYP